MVTISPLKIVWVVVSSVPPSFTSSAAPILNLESSSVWNGLPSGRRDSRPASVQTSGSRSQSVILIWCTKFASTGSSSVPSMRIR